MDEEKELQAEIDTLIGVYERRGFSTEMAILLAEKKVANKAEPLNDVD